MLFSVYRFVLLCSYGIMKADQKFPDLTTTGLVAKLLARENITVLKGNYHTASFDTKNRILYLPLLKDTLSKNCADMFVGHEVGHALYTPVELIMSFQTEHPNIPFSYLNIIEDIRIERMIQETYPGLISSFNAAYRELAEIDIFKIRGVYLNALCLPDRINLHAKIGTIVAIPLSAVERAFFDRCYKAKTIEEVLALTLEMASMVQGKTVKKKFDDVKISVSDNDVDEIINLGEPQEAEPAEPELGDVDELESNGKAPQSDPSNRGDTAFSSNSSPSEPLGETETDKAVDEFFSSNVEESAVNIVSAPSRRASLASVTPYSRLKAQRLSGEIPTKQFDEFIKSLISSLEEDANVLVSEFTVRRAALNYQRTSQKRTGKVDTNALHRYKISEDIFQSLTVEPNQQNHGMIMFVDYSGSMKSYNAIQSVLRQVLSLAFFCRKLSIPFDVYGFTSGQVHPSEQADRIEKMQVISRNQLKLEFDTKIFNIISSNLSSSDFAKAARCIAGQIVTGMSFSEASTFTENLGGTPLLETVIVAHELVKDFRIKHQVQNMNVVILSDGDGSSLRSSSSSNYSRSSLMLHGRQVNFKSICFKDAYSALIENLRETQSCKVIGYFIAPNKTKGVVATSEKTGILSSKLKEDMADQGFTTTSCYNFDEYYIIQSSTYNSFLSDSQNLGFGKITPEMSINQIKSALMSDSKQNRKRKILLRSLAKTFAI